MAIDPIVPYPLTETGALSKSALLGKLRLVSAENARLVEAMSADNIRRIVVDSDLYAAVKDDVFAEELVQQIAALVASKAGK